MTTQARSESVNFCEYWPLPIGNWWQDSGTIADVEWMWSVNDQFFEQGYESWEVVFTTYSFGRPTAQSYFLYYQGGSLIGLVNRDAIGGGGSQADVQLLFPRHPQIGRPAWVSVPGWGPYGLTPVRGSLSTILDSYETPWTLDDFSGGDRADVIAFVGETPESDVLGEIFFIFARDEGLLLYFFPVRPETVQPGGCPQSEGFTSVSPGYFQEEGTRVEISIPGPLDLMPSIQWMKNGTPMMDGGRISGTQSATLVIDPLEMSDSGTYLAEYENGLKAASTYGPFSIQVVAAGSLPLGWVALISAGAVILATGIRMGWRSSTRATNAIWSSREDR